MTVLAVQKAAFQGVEFVGWRLTRPAYGFREVSATHQGVSGASRKGVTKGNMVTVTTVPVFQVDYGWLSSRLWWL